MAAKEVFTTHGVLPREQLVAKDIVTEEENARVIATEWYLGDELVRRDVWVSILVSHESMAEQAHI